jgi:hypothetical protein
MSYYLSRSVRHTKRHRLAEQYGTRDNLVAISSRTTPRFQLSNWRACTKPRESDSQYNFPSKYMTAAQDRLQFFSEAG